jgi:hypothetical protein
MKELIKPAVIIFISVLIFEIIFLTIMLRPDIFVSLYSYFNLLILAP